MEENKKSVGKNYNYLDDFTDNEILEFYSSSLTLKEFSEKLGYKNALDRRSKRVYERLNSIGINLSKFKNVKHFKKETSNRQKKHYCKNCNNEISHTNKSGYCNKCSKEKQDEEKINKWLKTGDTGCLVGSNIRNCIRDYIYKSQNYKCAICGIENMWNKKELKFVLDHIDGDASNNYKDNLRLICPNCDSQLDTYKSKNKNSARNFRHKYYETYNDLTN